MIPMKTTMRLSGFEDYLPLIDEIRSRLRKENIIRRINERDYTVWKAEPEEIVDRLGWLDSHRKMAGEVNRIK
ncbi:MAG: hypothetical protein PHU03_06150, partial [Syntrophales bacterium]|nr:hypothetical protein [Syntrophales bacterium]